MSKSLKALLLCSILISFGASPSHSLFVKKSIEVDEFADYDEQRSYATIRVDFRKSMKTLLNQMAGLMLKSCVPWAT
ncbi:hypothetical protein [Candidatus Nucleicultrix amoebiphila]|uniref:Uncharacterized protein n=1 Tax=Candidatus Nucleicultrix amoebiphila FS5 TaxID=1414854 RepID=A0A1W6N4G2_9PROT|nr:hypothetical protein [Candidatus Nucleicultrix amoebiphila]ARN84743.1 hypothetical protein GQ61_04905 [Candidatus Nucleicultrix amoebiphila FS5]